MYAASQIFVGPSGALVIPGGNGPGDLVSGVVRNITGTATVVFGHPSSGLSATVGFPLAPTDILDTNAKRGQDLWAAAPATQVLSRLIDGQ